MQKPGEKRILGHGHSTHKGPEVGMCLTGSSRARGGKVNEGQTQVGLEQGELQLQGEGWRGDTPEAPHMGSPSLFHHVPLLLGTPILASA